MPKSKTSSSILSKLGPAGKKAFSSHRSDETDYGSGGSLPAGIDDGIAQLVDCDVRLYKTGKLQGKPFFYAAGSIVHPKATESGYPLEGKRTSIMEPLCDTPESKGKRKTLSDHMAWVLNELRKLGLDTKEVDYDTLEAAMASLVEEGVTFAFRTWKGSATPQFPDPQVQETWEGAVDYETEETEEVEDSSEEEEEPEAEEEEETEEEAEEEAEEEPEAEEEDGDDILALGQAADAEDEEAAAKLEQLALAAGYEQSAIDEAESWVAIAESLLAEGGATEEEGDATGEDPDWEPQKEDVYLYKAKGKRKATEHEVTAVFPGKKTVNLRNLDDGKIFKGVPWDKLESGE